MSGHWHPAATSSSTISINRRAVLSSCSDRHAQGHGLPQAPALACSGNLTSMTFFGCFARKLNEPEVKEHSREKPV
jgi:hypothetical protein